MIPDDNQFVHMHMPNVPERHEATQIPPFHGAEYVLGDLLPDNFQLHIERNPEMDGITIRIHGMLYAQTILSAAVEMSLARGRASDQSLAQVLAYEHKGIALDLARFLEEEAAALRKSVEVV